MASNDLYPALAVRSSVGVELWRTTGLKVPYAVNPQFARDESKICRTMTYSPDGRYLAWANGSKVQICQTTDWSIVCSLPRPKAFYLKFSPNGTYLVTWELFSINKEMPEGAPNLYIYKTATGEQVFATIQKRNSDWEPEWSSDERLLGFLVGGEGVFHEIGNGGDGDACPMIGFDKATKRFGCGKTGRISISPGSKPNVAFHIPGSKGVPSMCKIFDYADLQANQPIGCKSFFQADKVEMKWNNRGSGLLLLTSTDVDTTGSSYYGKQALHFMNVKGDSFAVQLSKEGPIYEVEWNPKSNEFCVVHGFMPAKVSFFNLKCDLVKDCGEGPRNSIYYNPFGNLVLLCGFGNLPGNVEVYDVEKKQEFCKLQASDTTQLEWCPNGVLFVTATTAPRLRMSNGFKIWHYSGALLHETMWPTGQELLQVSWQTVPNNTFPEPKISNIKIEGIKSSQPIASRQAYVPPNARGIPLPAGMGPVTPPTAKDYYAQRAKLKKNQIGQQATGETVGQPYAGNKPMTGKNRKRGGRKQASDKDANGSLGEEQQKSGSVQNVSPRQRGTSLTDDTVPVTVKRPPRPKQIVPTTTTTTFSSDNIQQDGVDSGDNESNVAGGGADPNRRRIKRLSRRLNYIDRLIGDRESGKQLNENQEKVIRDKPDVIRQLQALKVSN